MLDMRRLEWFSELGVQWVAECGVNKGTRRRACSQLLLKVACRLQVAVAAPRRWFPQSFRSVGRKRVVLSYPSGFSLACKKSCSKEFRSSNLHRFCVLWILLNVFAVDSCAAESEASGEAEDH